MALVIKDRVKQTSTTTGTGTLTLNGTVDGFQTFAAALSDGDTTYYALLEPSTNEWEVGLGTWTEGSSLLARTTILASSNAGSAVSLTAQSEVFITQPATKAAFFNAAGDLELNRDPQSALQAATKQYVDTIAAAGIHYHDPVRVESPTNLNATYDNGTSGVGATLTNAGTQAAITIDGVALSSADRVLIYNQTNAAHNGIYTVTTVGDGSTNWVLTRSTDADSYGVSDPNAFGEGDAFFVKEGDTGAGELYVMNTSGTITFGTTNITFSVIAETAVYSAGNGVTLTGTTFSADAGTGVTVDGSGINIGQAVETSSDVTFNSVTASLSGNVTGNVSGDVTGNADTATALETARNIGGVSFDGTASINLPGVNTTGNQNTTGNAATATAWATGRTISLTGDVTGSVTGVDGTGNASIATTIQPNSVALGTDTTGDYVSTVTSGNYLTGGTTGEGSTPTLNVDATPNNTASKVVARDASGNFSAGTITGALSGNATTASSLATARNIALSGDVSGNVNFDGSGNVTITTTVADDSHNHVISNVDGLQTALDGKLSTSGKAADSDLLDGYNSSQSENSNTVAVRNASGYLFSSYFNGSGTFSTTGVNSGMARFTGTNGTDTYGRSYTAAAARTLLNVEYGATADQTASEILTAIKTVDGSGSGLDADTVDGIQGSSIVQTSDSRLTNSRTCNNSFDNATTAKTNLGLGTGNTPSFAGLNINGNLNAVDNIYLAGTLYHEGDTNTYLSFSTDTVYLASGGTDRVIVDNTGVRLGDTGNGYFQPVTGNYGSIQIDGGGHGSYEGYSIGGRVVFMHDNSITAGIYNDVDNEWMLHCQLNGAVSLYHNNSSKLQTTSSGANISGNLYLTGSVGEDYDALSGTSPTCNVDNAGAFSLTMSGNTTFTFSGADSGYSMGFILQLTGNGGTVTWPASVKWAGGTAPDAPASGETDVLVFHTRDGGTNWYGVLSSDAAA